MSKLISNYLFNVLFQFLMLISPLLSTPYIARVLNPEGIGISSYSTSIVQIFTFLAMFGIHIYGNRQIAFVSHKGKKELSNQFWSIYSVQILSSLISIVIYLLFINFYIDEHKGIFLIQSFALLGILLDVSWLFIGLEKLKRVILRNAVVKLISLVMIFTFVKEPQDVYLYILINVLANVLGQLIMWVEVPKYIERSRIKIKHITLHFKPMIIMFLPLIFVQIYSVYNRVALGAILTDIDVGYYDQAVKIVGLITTVVTSLGAVMLPRISSEYSKGNHENIKHYIDKVLRFVLFITMPMCIGLISISSVFIPLFLGPGYTEVIILVQIISPIIIFIGCANVFGMQILIATKQQNKYTFSVAIGAVLSLITNIFLIGSLGSKATALALLVAEGVGVLIQAFLVRKYVNFKFVFNYAIKYFLASLFMGGITYYIGKLELTEGIMTLFFQISVAIFIYLMLMILLRDEFVFYILKKFNYLIKMKRFTSRKDDL